MRELTPGIWHWTTFYDSIGMEVSSYWVEPAGIVIDPMVPQDVGLDWWDGRDVHPQQVVLTIGLHWRHSEQFAERWNVPIRVPWPALERYQGTDRVDKVEKYEWHDEVAPGVTAVQIDAIAPDEAALHIAHGDGAVAIADGLIRTSEGGSPLGFVPDSLIGHAPPAAKAGLRDSSRGLVPRDW